ncbi:MAG: HAD-IA family hydrolase [Chloroflexota bacterium]
MHSSRPIEFVIFDLDGTLVDSETLCNVAFLDLVPELKTQISVEELVWRNRGRKLVEILRGLESDFGLAFAADFEPLYRRRVQELFSSELKPVCGVPDMLEALKLPKCVASSGPLAKIQHALDTCGLLRYFEGHLYSSYEVGFWKPDPGLFRYAMSQEGFAPEQCAVVEDSEVGIQAAKAAGIRPFYYCPGRLLSEATDCVVFQSMAELPKLLGD